MQNPFNSKQNNIIFTKLYTDAKDVRLVMECFVYIWPYSSQQNEPLEIKPQSSKIIKTGLSLTKSIYKLYMRICDDYEKNIRIRKHIFCTNDENDEFVVELSNVSETETVCINLEKPFVQLVCLKLKKNDSVNFIKLFTDVANPVPIDQHLIKIYPYVRGSQEIIIEPDEQKMIQTGLRIYEPECEMIPVLNENYDKYIQLTVPKQMCANNAHGEFTFGIINISNVKLNIKKTNFMLKLLCVKLKKINSISTKNLLQVKQLKLDNV